MGIRFLDSILILASAAAGVLTVYFGGYGLVYPDQAWAWITAVILLLFALGGGTLTVRRLRSYAEARGETPKMR